VLRQVPGDYFAGGTKRMNTLQSKTNIIYPKHLKFIKMAGRVRKFDIPDQLSVAGHTQPRSERILTSRDWYRKVLH